MTEPVDISYYLGKAEAEAIGNLDVPLSNSEIVSINLVEELPDDPNELISFLENEKPPAKYWIAIAAAYARAHKLEDSLLVAEKALNSEYFSQEDKTSVITFRNWLYLKFASSGANKEEYLQKIAAEIEAIPDDLTDNQNSLLKAVFYLMKDKADLALEIFDKLSKLNDKNCYALLGKAQITLNKTKNYSNALKFYQQVLIINPLIKPDPRIGIGLCFWFLKDHKMAITSWERSIELDPTNLKAKILVNLAKFHFTFNNSLTDEEFVKNYEECLHILKSNYELSSDDPAILLVFASYYFSIEKYDLVEKITSEVIKLITGSSDQTTKLSSLSGKLTKYQLNILSQCTFWLGRVHFVKQDFNHAQRYFHESIRLNEDNLLSKLGLGQSQIGRGSIQEAIITFESILKTNPKNLEVNYSLGLLYSKQKSRKRADLAISMLERYISLSNNRGLTSTSADSEDISLTNKEPITLNAYLILSKLYESRDMSQSLNYLNKAVESRQQIKQNIPLEIYNNIGVFNFNRNNTPVAIENFELALKTLNEKDQFLDESGEVIANLKDDLYITLNYNLARAKELKSEEEAIQIYEDILNRCPNYSSAKLRLLFLDAVLTNKSTKQEIKEEIERLLEINASDLEIRSFYGWFMKTFGKKLGVKPDADTNHQKETLVEYNSHDCYALISLANIYCIMARELKSNANLEKRKKYYIRAVELFSKVLSIDSKNVYAAQGLAIVYIENKELNKGLDILRKIRDSLNDISVYLNLGHVLVDLKQYNKAIESYEIASSRFTGGNDANILTFLGKAWYLRGNAEKRLPFLFKSLEYTETALANSVPGRNASFRFNKSFVQFQIADFMIKLPVSERRVEDINTAIINLNEGIRILNDLSSDDERNPPYSKSDLKARADLGTNTLLNRLNICLEETKEYNEKLEIKLDEAKKLREEELHKKLAEDEAEMLRRQLEEEERAKERVKLQEQAQQWVEETRLVGEEDAEDDKLFEEDNEKTSKKAKAKKGKGKGKGKKSKKNFIDDSEEDAPSPSDSEPSDNEDEEKNGGTKDKSKPKGKRSIPDDEDDEENSIDASKKRKVTKSNEFIEDSDEGMDDGLFNE